MRPVWAAADPASHTMRQNDALDAPTPHRVVATRGGDYWLCGATGQIERIGIVEHLISLYDEHWQGLIDEGRSTLAMYDTADRTLARLERHARPGRLFEVASGLGTVLKAAQRRGWAVDGVELSPVAAAFASQLIGSPVRAGAIEDVTLEPASYDLIILDNIFEHLERPRRVMDMLARALAPGGVLYLQTLNAQAYSLRAQPRDWIYYGAGHLCIPTLVSFEHYVKHCGLERLRWVTKGYRPRGDRDEARISRLSRGWEKLVSNLAKATNRGHHIQCILRKPR